MHGIDRCGNTAVANPDQGGDPAVTVLDDLRVVEERIATRLAELEPLVQEYNELQEIAARLSIDPGGATAAAPKPAPKPAKPKAKAKPAAKKLAAKPNPAPQDRTAKGAAVRRQPGGTQRAGAERRESMLTLIRERPGITVPELSEALEVDAPSLYRVVRKLQSDGTTSKDGKALRVMSGAPAAA